MTAEIANYEPPPSGSMATITGGHLPQFMEWAKAIAVSALLPDALRGKPADVMIAVFHGLDLGLKPMQAINMVDVIKGRPSLSAKGMRALLMRDGHEFRVVTCDMDSCVVQGRRKGTDVWHEAAFTDAQRRAAKLTGANWDAYREDMLLARATTRLCNRYFADVIGGLDGSEDLLDRQEPVTRPTLGEVAAERATPTVEPEVIDAEIVEEENRRSLAEMEAAHHAPPAAETADLFAGADVEDPPADYTYDDDAWKAGAPARGKR